MVEAPLQVQAIPVVEPETIDPNVVMEQELVQVGQAEITAEPKPVERKKWVSRVGPDHATPVAETLAAPEMIPLEVTESKRKAWAPKKASTEVEVLTEAEPAAPGAEAPVARKAWTPKSKS